MIFGVKIQFLCVKIGLVNIFIIKTVLDNSTYLIFLPDISFSMKLVYKLIYHPVLNRIIRNVNFVLAPILPNSIKIHPSGVLKVKTQKGSIKVSANQTSYVARELFWKGSERYEYTPIFADLISKMEVFYDIGSSIGYYSILGAHLNPKLYVEAFEPTDSAAYYLKENIRINDLGNQVSFNEIAISDQKGDIDFFVIKNKKYPNTRNLSGEHNMGTKLYLSSNKIRVNTITLDQFVFEENHRAPDLIKLDTEGSEHFILQHSTETINKHKPIIICEVLFSTIEKEIETIILSHGYDIYAFKEGKLHKIEKLSREHDDGVRDCFFVHPEKRYCIEPYLVK